MGTRLVYNGPRFGAIHRVLDDALATALGTTQDIQFVCRTAAIRPLYVEQFIRMARGKRVLFSVDLDGYTFTFRTGSTVTFTVPERERCYTHEEF